MKTIKFVMTLIVLVLFFSCAHHDDVRPGTSGIHRVKVMTDDETMGTRDAIEQANHFCKTKGKSAEFIDENKEYTGSLDEKDYKHAKRASKVAQSVGGMVHVFGGKKESQLGGVVGVGGIVGDTMLGNEYQIEMKFKCN